MLNNKLHNYSAKYILAKNLQILLYYLKLYSIMSINQYSNVIKEILLKEKDWIIINDYSIY